MEIIDMNPEFLGRGGGGVCQICVCERGFLGSCSRLH